MEEYNAMNKAVGASKIHEDLEYYYRRNMRKGKGEYLNYKKQMENDALSIKENEKYIKEYGEKLGKDLKKVQE